MIDAIRYAEPCLRYAAADALRCLLLTMRRAAVCFMLALMRDAVTSACSTITR